MTQANKIITMTEEQLSNYNNKMLEHTINGINQAHQQAISKRLSEFSKEELEKELISREKCQFKRLSCTETAEDYIIKPFNYQKDPTCSNCKNDILAMMKGGKK